MYKKLSQIIENLHPQAIHDERKKILRPLTDFIRQKVNGQKEININFICTHNSRRSILSQIWAQVAASYFNIPNINSSSGGTEQTALFPKIAETLSDQGFIIFKISESNNPIYAVRYSENTPPIIAFSKKHDNPYNPASVFAAVMTCSQADSECPFIAGAEKRISIPFADPKASDNTPEQAQIYAERSLQIATEMFYVFSQITQ